MLKKILIAFLCSLLLFGFRPRQDFGPEILNWDTFYMAKPDANSTFYALTALTFNYSYEATIRKNQLSLKFKFKADVDKSKSWIKKDKLANRRISEALLNHEQGHVNINYLLMRETEKRLLARRYNTKTYKTEIEETAKKVYIYYDEMQKMYDEETGHGIKNRSQGKWDSFIEQALSEYPRDN